jgi:hypothetical protein
MPAEEGNSMPLCRPEKNGICFHLTQNCFTNLHLHIDNVTCSLKITLKMYFDVLFPYSTAQCYPQAYHANLKIVNSTGLNYIVLIDAY